MIINYNPLSTGRDTSLRNDVEDATGSPPASSESTRTRWFAFLLLFLSIFIGQNSYAQVAYTQNFNAGAASWTGFSSLTGSSACGGSGGSMVYNLYSGATAANFVSPFLGTSNGSLHTLTFDYKVAVWSANTTGQSGDWGNFNVQWSTAAAGPWTTLATINNTNHVVSGTCANKSYTFTPPNGATVYLRFNAAWGTTGDYYLNFDNVSLQGIATAPPNCATGLVPADLGTNVARNPTLSWTAATGAPSSYDVYFGSSSTPPLAGNVLGTSYVPVGPLAANAVYYWRVVPKNLNGDASGCTTQSFTTGTSLVYCVGATTNGCASGDHITNVNFSSINNTTAACISGGSYSDYLAGPQATVWPGSYAISVSVANGGTEYAGAWFDWNQNGLFEASEFTALTDANAVAPWIYTGTVVVPPGAVLGTTRMRVRSSYNATIGSNSSCDTYSYGETEDYTVNVTTPPSCFAPPAAPTASAVTNNSATISWTASTSAPADGYEYYVSTTITAPTAGTVATGAVAAGVTTINLSSLAANTTHYVYIRSVCSASEKSIWTGASTFTTLCDAVSTFPWNEGFETTSPTISCFRVINANADANTWAIGTNAPRTGTRSAQLYTDVSTTNNDYLITPQLALGSAAKRVRFWVRANSTGEPDEISVRVSTTGTALANFSTVVLPSTPVGSTTYTEITVDLSAFTNMNIYIAFVRDAAPANGWYLYLDDIIVENLPSCFVPTNLVVATPTATTANLSWSAPTPTPAVGYEYAVTTSATPPASGTATAVTSASVGSLVGGTTYYLHVRSECIAGVDYSVWATKMFKYIAGDNCSNAIDLASLTSPLNGNTTGATDDYSITCAGGNTSPDLFYYIDVPPSFTLVIGQTDNAYDSENYLGYGGACPGTTQVACYDDSDIQNSTYTNNTASTVRMYWIQDGYFNETNFGTFTLAWTLTPPPIGITSFSPEAVCQNGAQSVTIIGTNFTGVTDVQVNGASVDSFVINSDTSITAVMTTTVSTGIITVYNAVTSASSDTSLTVNPEPTVAPITGPSFVCLPNTNTITLSSTTPTGVWSSSDVDIATVNASGVVTPVTVGDVIISYVVTDSGCSTTQTYDVSVNTPVVISSSTATQTVITGGDTSFVVVASGTPAGDDLQLTYQWEIFVDPDTEVDGDEYYTPLTDGPVYGGTDTAILTFTDVPVDLNETLYHLVITGACNVATTDLAVLIVGETGFCGQPENVTVCSPAVDTAAFTICASEDVTSIQWQEDQGGDNWTDLAEGGMYSGTTTATLNLTGLTPGNNGWKYRAFITGISTATSNAALLTVVTSASVTSDPSTQTVCYSGGTVNYTVGATGASSYQWQYSANGGGSWSNVANGTPTGASYSGALTASLNVTTTAATPVGGTYSYRAIVNSPGGCPGTNSNSAQLLFNTPAITGQPSATSVVVGGTATFTVSTSAASPSYQWQYATIVGGPYSNVVNATPTGITYTGANTATLSVVTSGTTTTSTARYYRAVVSSPVGCSSNSNGAQLTITDYCSTSYPSGMSGDQITNVTLGTLNNSSGASASPYYTYYSAAAVPNITQNTNASISISFGSDGNQYSAVWIDFNRNGAFEPGEGAISGNAGSNGTSVITLPVPLSAVPGVTRMRVRGGNDVVLTTAQACGVSSSPWGETEDYNVNIVAAPQCANPNGGSITSSVANVCVSGTVTLTATGYSTGEAGLSYQWYNSAGAIASANGFTYTTPVLSAPESYYFKVTCSNSALSANSNTINIGVNNPSITASQGDTRCGPGAVLLSATGSAGSTVNWYTAASGGLSIYTGSSYAIPNLDSTTIFYAEAGIGFSSGSAGATGNATLTNATNVGGHGIMFNTTQPNVQIVGVKIPFTGTGTFTIAVRDASGVTTISSAVSSSVTGSGLVPVSVPVSLTVPAAGNYTLIVTGITGSIGNLGYSTGTYPSSALAGAFTVTSGYWYAADPNNMYLYDITVTSGCASSRVAVTGTVNPAPALTISSNAATICSGTSTPTVTITTPQGNFDTYTWTPASGVSGSAAAGYTFSPAVSTVYTLTGNQTGGDQCQNMASYNVTVNQSPTAITITPTSATMCSNQPAQLLTASGGIVQLNAVPIMTENFNTDAPTWTITNGGSSPAVSNFQYVSSPYTGGPFSNFSTTNGGKFAYSNADVGGSGSTTNTVLTSPVFSTVGYTSASLSFEHFYTAYSADVTVALEISTNGGTSWATLVDYKGTTVGSTTATAPATVSLASYLGQSNLRIRYNYVSSWGYYWVIDGVNVSGSGSGQGNVIWSPTAGLYTDAAGTIAYTGTPALSVYAKPASSTTYTTTVTSSAGCPTTNTVAVSMETAANYYADTDGDGYGNLATTYFGCAQAGYVTNSTDCNDSIAAINPGATEVLYDGVDNNCNNQLDEGNQLTTSLLPSVCNTTLASIGSLIGITTVSSSITMYRIRVTNGAQVQIIERNVPHFTLPNLPNYDYATTYTVEVELQRNGVWLGYYGSPCNVSSPAVLAEGGATQVNPSQCGITLARINTLIATTSLQGASGYKFQVTNITPGASGPNVVQTIERTQHWFSLVMLTQYNYGSTYRVEVAVKTNGVYSGFGAPCEVSSPAAPQLINCGGVVASSSTLVAATSLQGVTQYRFQVTRMSDNATTTIDRNTNSFSFNMVPAYTPAAQYAVRVAVMTVGTWSPFGDACEITSPGSASRFVEATEATSSVFKAAAYPNPFASTFAIDVTSSLQDNVQINVYDMTGRLIETRQARTSDLNTLQVGDRYPSGVYNVIVTQGANVETLRVIKR